MKATMVRFSRFNSLQTGNCIQTGRSRQRRKSPRFQFQFPSNGKLHSNATDNRRELLEDFGFNSLQTGNCIQTRLRSRRTCSLSRFQFPSNGKLHSNITTGGITAEWWYKFQFPSNGKLHSNDIMTGEFYSTVEGFNSLQTGNCIQTTL